MTRYIGIDFETFGAINLPVHGLDRYINDESFEPLIVSLYDPRQGSPFTYDFVMDPTAKGEFLTWFRTETRRGSRFVAHNVGFERAVLKRMGLTDDELRGMFDSAVISRCEGAASALEAAGPQLTEFDKLETGWELIKLFSIPNDDNKGKPFSRKEIVSSSSLFQQWGQFIEYCEMDAKVSYTIADYYDQDYYFESSREQGFELLTHQMNQNGWFVDLPLVREMKVRFEQNVADAVESFFQNFPNTDSKFFNSHKQMTRFCEDRGVRAKSFSADATATMIPKIEKALAGHLSTTKWVDYSEVLRMLKTKEELGGSSLKKLQVILDTTSEDGRLRNQYMHCGAGQTYRTSARGVQLQNLKRLNEDLMDMDSLFIPSTEATNTELAANLRQVFKAQHPYGRLIVGDFGSVESRGLAYLAGEDWKLESYRQGKDIYKVLASKFSGVPYEKITKEARKEGKYSELSCGYQAGGQAVKDFMHALGFEVDLPGAQQRVNNWREANPAIVELWAKIDRTLHDAVSSRDSRAQKLANDLILVFEMTEAPESLRAQHPGVQSMRMKLFHGDVFSEPLLVRVFHGVYKRGESVCYYKPSDRKTGDLWNKDFVDPKTKQKRFYSIYGGKLSGILTQSLCREIFMNSLAELSFRLEGYGNVKLVGQFHDEIVVEWEPSVNPLDLTLAETKSIMEECMSTPITELSAFPLTAEIKDDYRYTK